MLKIRRSEERGHAQHDWLDSYHTFSFAQYYDPRFMGFRSLRVINEDRIAGGGGFPPHPHRDMEIITYVISGSLEHQDSMGNGSVIGAGDVQYMSAGTGVIHSEFNHSQTKTCHLLQIWIETDQPDAEPRYDQRTFTRAEKLNRLRLIADPHGRGIHIRQSAELYASVLERNQQLEYIIRSQHGVWLQLVSGELSVNGTHLQAGDALSTTTEASLKLGAVVESEFLLFDLLEPSA